jgi:hypothetical protein
VQAADEAKQIVTYGRDYFNSPWNYMDCSSCVIIAILFLLHVSRLNHQVDSSQLLYDKRVDLFLHMFIHHPCPQN